MRPSKESEERIRVIMESIDVVAIVIEKAVISDKESDTLVEPFNPADQGEKRTIVRFSIGHIIGLLSLIVGVVGILLSTGNIPK